MINENVINEIYKKFSKPHKNDADLRLDYFIPILAAHHSIENDGFEIILKDVEEFSPFRRFLIRSLNAVLEFDKLIAFVFRTHILFLGKEDNQLHVHIKPEKKKGLFGRLFSH
ncbi:MAG: hypothetical protein J1E78_07115 [Muribaculaceae bacterium]|nr:hypothetical protein [Muribaculaceae bacterium]